MQLNNSTYFALVEEQLSQGRTVKLLLHGSSMQSALHSGDTILIAPLLDHTPSVGDVVLFRYRGRHLLHRVVRVDASSYTLRGDNCLSTEHCHRSDIIGLLVAHNGLPTSSHAYHRRTRRSLLRGRIKRFAYRLLGTQGRKRLRPYYFAVLAFLMWAPLGGVGISLNNYIVGIRADHLLHASVYLPCALFLADLFRRRPLPTWLTAIAIGCFTEGVQYLLPYRGFDINDLIANAIGTTVGCFAIYYWWHLKKKM